MPYPHLHTSLLIAGGVSLAAARLPAQNQDPVPPVAREVPKVGTLLGEVRVDPYFWLRDDTRSSPDQLRVVLP